MLKCLNPIRPFIFVLVSSVFGFSITAKTAVSKPLDCMTNNAAPTYITLTKQENSDFELLLQLNNYADMEPIGAQLGREILSSLNQPADVVYTYVKVLFSADQCKLYSNKTISCAGQPKSVDVNGITTSEIISFNFAVIRNVRSFPGGSLMDSETFDISTNLEISTTNFPNVILSDYLSNAKSTVLSCKVITD